MGGVVRELDLLARASALNGPPDGPPSGPSEITPPELRPETELYQRLLRYLKVSVDIDMISGTSAGGINGVFLALARVRGCDLSSMREMWLKLGSLLDLLREPNDKAVPSLLYGDEWMYDKLLSQLKDLADHGHPHNVRPGVPVQLHVTTTLLSGEEDAFVDSFGTNVPNTNHRGVFTFTAEQLASDGIDRVLALAARSTASFPGAFEPSFIPVGTSTPAAGKVAGRPDMAEYTNFSRSHWVSDGGVLNNMPLGLVLDDIFERPAQRDVRRALLYVIPTTTPSTGPTPVTSDNFDEPYGLVDGLLKNVSALAKQSVARDLSAIRDHNDRVTARRSKRLQIVELAMRAPSVRLLTLEQYCDYLDRITEHTANRLVDALLSTLSAAQIEATRTVLAVAASSTSTGAASTDPARRLESVRPALVAQARQELNSRAPYSRLPADASDFTAAGRAAFDGMKAIALSVLRTALALANDEQHGKVLAAIKEVHDAAEDRVGDTKLRALAGQASSGAATAEDALRTLVSDFQRRDTVSADRWGNLAGALNPGLLEHIAFATGESLGASEMCRPQPRDRDLATLQRYFIFLFNSDRTTEVQLFDLSVTEHAHLPTSADPDQLVDLIQVSADSTCGLAPERRAAARKLTGLQLRNFGAFYKRSWRANDWMWGRLDGAGWLVHLLLDPKRLVQIAASAPPGVAAASIAAGLADAVGITEPTPPEVLANLAFLDGVPAADGCPPDVAVTSIWLAEQWQRRIASEEFPIIAAAVDTDHSPAESRAWAAQAKAPDADVRQLLRESPVADERFTSDVGTPLMMETLTKAAATTTSAAAGVPAFVRAAKPLLVTAQTITQGAYVTVRAFQGDHPRITIAGLIFTAFGAVLAAQNSTIFSLSGLAIALIGLYLVVLCAWQGGKRTAVALLSATVVVLLGALIAPSGRTILFGDTKKPGVLANAVFWLGTEPWHPLVAVIGIVAAVLLSAIIINRRPHWSRPPAAHSGRPVHPVTHPNKADHVP